MKILSYNINGLRAAEKKGLTDWIGDENPDILCLQETKLQPGQVNMSLYEHFGYYNYWHSAHKKGYSGVAMFSKMEPDKISLGMGMEQYDVEGRVIRADFRDLTQICVYIPSGTMGGLRQVFKMEFLKDFINYLNHLRKERPKLIVSGDFNICHKPIDINHPERHHKSSGFLPEERAWMDKFVENGFVDTFRLVNDMPEQYSWWSYRANARVKNLGWRIDYHFVSTELKLNVKNASIHSDIVHSDHCPVALELDF